MLQSDFRSQVVDRPTSAPATGAWGQAMSAMSQPSQGGASNPFGYTDGSLLTPWTRKFEYSGGSGGSGVAEFKPFSYGDFSYNVRNPGQFGEQYRTPDKFSYGDFQAPDPFKAPTAADMGQDPGYQFRLSQGMGAMQNAAAARGLLRTGGTFQALNDYAQDAASQEYGNVYNRRASEYDRAYGQARDVYGINRGNAAENFDRNTSAGLNAYQARLGAFKTNADVSLAADGLGLQAATGAWDRNFAKARQGYEDERGHAQAVASAGAAAANQDYARQLMAYQMERDDFRTNQDRQYNMLMGFSGQGLGAAGAMAGYGGAYAGASGGYMTGAGNARAAGQVGGANAWNQALGNIGNTAMAWGLNQAYGARPPQGNPYGYAGMPGAGGSWL